MTSFIPPTLDRRSGLDRRGLGVTPPGAASDLDETLAPPFSIAPELEQARLKDPWATVVARALADYRDRRVDDVSRSWDDRLVWRVVGSWPEADHTSVDGV